MPLFVRRVIAALGGDNVSIIEDDPSLTFSNPALLSSVSDKTLNLNFMTYMEGAITGSAAFNRVVNDKASWAVLGQYINYGKMKETDQNNVQTGEFSAQEIALAGTFSYMLAKNLAGGITARWVASYIGGYSSMAAGIDLGLNYYDPESEFSVSAVAKNPLQRIRHVDEQRVCRHVVFCISHLQLEPLQLHSGSERQSGSVAAL